MAYGLPVQGQLAVFVDEDLAINPAQRRSQVRSRSVPPSLHALSDRRPDLDLPYHGVFRPEHQFPTLTVNFSPADLERHLAGLENTRPYAVLPAHRPWAEYYSQSLRDQRPPARPMSSELTGETFETRQVMKGQHKRHASR